MIMNYEGILEFKGTWRRYQARVLEHADRYMADGKIHIVAAPGSGKTTLGIEHDPQDERKSTDFGTIHYDPGAVDRKD